MEKQVHADWYHDGIEEGRDLWRLDLRDVQIQASIDVTNLDDELDGCPAEHGNAAKIFIEHDVRGGGPTGEDRTKYSFDGFDTSPEELFALLAMDKATAERTLHADIRRVQLMPTDPRYMREIQTAKETAVTQPQRFFYCVTRDNDDEYRAYGPYKTQEASDAFDDAIEVASVTDLVSLGSFEAVDEDEAINMAQAAENEAEQPE